MIFTCCIGLGSFEMTVGQFESKDVRNKAKRFTML